MQQFSVALICMVLLISPVKVQPTAAGIDPDIPDEVEEACTKYGDMYDICPELLEAICYHESRYISDVQNGTCKGLMQINTPYHKDRMKRLEVSDIYDIDSNIHVGADYLAELFDTYKDVAVVLGYYHGESNVESKVNSGKLSSYTKAILEKSESLERAHGK